MQLPVYFILPYPPSDNEKYACRTNKAPSAIYKHYVEVEVRNVVLECGSRMETITEPVRATVWLYPKHHRRDATNCLKVLFDALEKNGIIKNDSLIKDTEVISCDTEASDVVIVEFAPRKMAMIESMSKKIKYLLKHYREQSFFASHAARAINEGKEIMNRKRVQ
jgi:Holliday junction resolvase